MTNTIYCTYLTTYSGDKLPPLYIGSTSIQKIKTGYHGSVESIKYKQIWITELKENPHLFETKILTTHSTREEAFEEEIRYQIEHNVVRSPEYINMSIANGKFLHIGHSDESKKKMSEAHKKRYENPEERKKLSEAQKKRYENPEERKKTSESGKGKKRGSYKERSEEAKKKNLESWTDERRKKASEFMKGRKLSEETKNNMSESAKKRYENPEERKKTSESMKGKQRGPYKKKL